MPTFSRHATLERVSGYAVLWQSGKGRPRSGRLEFDPCGLFLHGGHRGHEVRIEIPYDEIESLERKNDRIGPCRGIRLRTRSAGNLVIASFGGAGALTEIADTLNRVIGG